MIKNFAIKTAANPKFSTWFIKKNEALRPTRAILQPYKENIYRTERYKRSPIPHFIRILNNTGVEERCGDEYKCEKCSGKFQSRGNLQDHKRFKHQENSPVWSNKIM